MLPARRPDARRAARRAGAAHCRQCGGVRRLGRRRAMPPADARRRPDVAPLAFPRGAIDMIDAWFAAIDAAMAAALPPEAHGGDEDPRARSARWCTPGSRRARAQREALRRALAILAMPQNLAHGAKLGWRSADAMWRAPATPRPTSTIIPSARPWPASMPRPCWSGSTTRVRAGPTPAPSSTGRIDGVMRFEKAKAQLPWSGDAPFQPVALPWPVALPVVSLPAAILAPAIVIDNQSQMNLSRGDDASRLEPLPHRPAGAVVGGRLGRCSSEREARRLRELGFDEGVGVEVLHRATLGKGPIACRIGRMTVALRRAVPAPIRVPVAAWIGSRVNAAPLVALVGNPNAGKSALFNALTGARQKVGNYPGVTVERKSGRLTLADGRPVELVDLPGAYSLDPSSPDEEVTRDV